MASDKSSSTRLTKALKYLDLATVSRELPYEATPYVLAAKMLIQAALDIERK